MTSKNKNVSKNTSVSKNTRGKQLNWIQFCLQRPEVNIDSIEDVDQEMWLEEDGTIIYKTTRYNGCFHRIHIEPLSNCIDNKWRSEKNGVVMKTIRIVVDAKEGKCMFYNDGYAIPVELSEFEYEDPYTKKTITKEMYPAQLYFGEWMAGTNYDDAEERKTSGKNGMGVKTTNIFSTYFEVECGDPVNKKKLTISFENNRSTASKPKVVRYAGKTGYTKLTFYPDFKRFGLQGYTPEWVGILKKDVYDCAMVTGLNVTFNGEKVNSRTLKLYSKLYFSSNKIVEFSTSQGDVVIVQDMDYEELRYISFVNGIYTKNGGVHVTKFRDAVLAEIRTALNSRKPKKGESELKITNRDLEPFLMFFVRIELDKPRFESQSKHELKGPPPKILKADKETISEVAKKMLKWDFVNTAIHRVKGKQQEKATKNIKKRANVSMGDKADDANWAGTAKSSQCVLYITEGQSAKSMVVIGRSAVKNGHDTIGAYALKGKPVNASKLSITKLNENEEVKQLRTILNLQPNTDYSKPENVKSLRYGKVRLLCDQDDDGLHICGLMMNFFYLHYQPLFHCSYIEIANTPLIRVYLKNNPQEFYSAKEFVEWRESHPDLKNKLNKGVVRYYKGLATHDDQEKKKIFMHPKIVEVKCNKTNKEKETMSLGFSEGKTYTDKRKIWMDANSSKNIFNVDELEDDGFFEDVTKEFIEGNVTLTEFVNHRLILYHIDNRDRSLPSVLDGLKVSQRKVLAGALQKNLFGSEKMIKVYQLGGYVSETQGYHHGDASLQGTIIKMAQSYTGANNISLLFPSGSFGTRMGKIDKVKSQGVAKLKCISGGDHGAPRYINTYLRDITRTIFPPSDFELLARVEDDGELFEPVNYVPVLPMLLVNGSVAIGSGWSTNIPQFNPLDLIKYILCWLGYNTEYPDIQPWWKGFKGEVNQDTEDDYYTYGIMNEVKKGRSTVYEVTELPVTMCTNTFKVFLEKLQDQGKLTFDNYSTEKEVKFVIKPLKGFVPDLKKDFSNLSKKVQMSNMVALDRNGKAKRYTNPEEILEEFCEVRLELYEKRKDHLLKKLNRDLQIASGRKKFIEEVIVKKTLKIYGEEIDVVEKELSRKCYIKIDGSYEYLLDMKFRAMTKKKIEALAKNINDLKKEIAALKKKTAKDLWIDDLAVFEKEYAKFLKE